MVICRLELILQRILFMSMGTVFLKDFHRRCIWPWTSPKGLSPPLNASLLIMEFYAIYFSLTDLLQSCYARYICSSGEKEFRSVLDLFEDYLKSWVCPCCNLKWKVSSCQSFCSCNYGCLEVLLLSISCDLYKLILYVLFISYSLQACKKDVCFSRTKSIQDLPSHDCSLLVDLMLLQLAWLLWPMMVCIFCCIYTHPLLDTEFTYINFQANSLSLFTFSYCCVSGDFAQKLSHPSSNLHKE